MGLTRGRIRGTAAVELAIVLPILLLVFLAVAEFSMMFLRWQSVTTAAREGARVASLFRPNCAASVDGAVTRAVTEVLSAAGLSGHSIALLGACTSPGSSTVTVSLPYQFLILPGFAAGPGGAIDLTSTSVTPNRDSATGAS